MCVRMCSRYSRWKEDGNPHTASAVPSRKCRRVIIRYSKRIRLEVLPGIAAIRVHRSVKATLGSAGRVAHHHAKAWGECRDVDACVVGRNVVDGHTAVLDNHEMSLGSPRRGLLVGCTHGAIEALVGHLWDTLECPIASSKIHGWCPVIRKVFRKRACRAR